MSGSSDMPIVSHPRAGPSKRQHPPWSRSRHGLLPSVSPRVELLGPHLPLHDRVDGLQELGLATTDSLMFLVALMSLSVGTKMILYISRPSSAASKP